MKTIALKNIIISPTRQRRDFDLGRLNELRESIVKRGLFHPIVLREDEGKFYLVAGERRLRAVTDLYELGDNLTFDQIKLPLRHIPYVNLGELDELDREEAELEENTHRVDLSWQEKAMATARLASLRQRQALSANLPLPSVKDITLEITGDSSKGNPAYEQATTRQEMLIAQHLDRPEISKAKSLQDAYKTLKRQESLRTNAAIGKLVGQTYSSKLHKCFQDDSDVWLREAPAGLYDVILTDPPYGMGADTFGDSAGKTGTGSNEHAYADDEDTFIRLVRVLAEQSIRITKPQAHLYCFCDLDNFHYLRDLFESVGWQVHRTPLIWAKTNGARVPWPECGPRRSYELILYAVRGKRPVTAIAPDVLTFAADPNLGHMAQKPVALFAELLKRSCRPGDQVLDPFCGTGPIFEAAQALQLIATGVELDIAHYGMSINRLERLSAQLELEV